jgi:GH15 family glucan-1,4-alpha-glucosidase
MREFSMILMALMTALSLALACTTSAMAYHWKQTADKYAYALSD